MCTSVTKFSALSDVQIALMFNTENPSQYRERALREAQILENHRTSYQQIAKRLESLIIQAETQAKASPSKRGTISIDNIQLNSVLLRGDEGVVDGLSVCPFSKKSCGAGDPKEIKNTKTKTSVTVDDRIIHMIEKHEFFGKTYFGIQVEPEDLITTLELKC